MLHAGHQGDILDRFNARPGVHVDYCGILDVDQIGHQVAEAVFAAQEILDRLYQALGALGRLRAHVLGLDMTIQVDGPAVDQHIHLLRRQVMHRDGVVCVLGLVRVQHHVAEQQGIDRSGERDAAQAADRRLEHVVGKVLIGFVIGICTRRVGVQLHPLLIDKAVGEVVVAQADIQRIIIFRGLRFQRGVQAEALGMVVRVDPGDGIARKLASLRQLALKIH